MKRFLSVNTSRVSIPVTPMLDMTFQLLFFFIINFRLLAPEGSIDLKLPQGPARGDPEKKAPVDPEPPMPSDLTVKVRTKLDNVNDGEISALSIVDAFGKEKTVDGLDGLKKALGALRPKLAKKDNIKVQGDGKLKVRNLMKVMDVCRQAGFKNVSMVPPEGFKER